MKKIIMFYGQECPHCHVMMPLVTKLEEEEDVSVTQLEVWHDEKNADKMRKHKKIISTACGGVFGVPAFLDEVGNRALCGEVDYEVLKKWALEK